MKFLLYRTDWKQKFAPHLLAFWCNPHEVLLLLPTCNLPPCTFGGWFSPGKIHEKNRQVRHAGEKLLGVLVFVLWQEENAACLWRIRFSWSRSRCPRFGRWPHALLVESATLLISLFFLSFPSPSPTARYSKLWTKPAASICVGGSWARTAERRLNGPPPSCVTRYGASSGISRTSRTLSISFCKDHWKINSLPGTQHYRIEMAVLLQQKDFEVPFKIAKYAIYSWFNSLFSVVSIINCTELVFLTLYMWKIEYWVS